MGKNASSVGVRRKGPEGFEAYYQAQFGERWPALRAALLAPSPLSVRRNGFADSALATRDLNSALESDFAKGCHGLTNSDATREHFTPSRDAQGLLTAYVMDVASVLAARSVDVPESSRVLDMCAAPGGKSLVLAERFAGAGELILNDRSPDRRKRLLQVLKDYVPAQTRSTIKVHQRDGRLWGKHEPDAYDAILLDAPCSSEEHVLRDARALEQWSETRSRRLHQEQLSLLRSALLTLRTGGLVVYCTCALSQQENDGAVSELLRREPRARVVPTSFPIGEPTQHGTRILPDTSLFGPLFVSRIQKIE